MNSDANRTDDEVLEALSLGLSREETATRLGIKPRALYRRIQTLKIKGKLNTSGPPRRR
jgi:DNA-binding NtrC family response regulator